MFDFFSFEKKDFGISIDFMLELKFLFFFVETDGMWNVHLAIQREFGFQNDILWKKIEKKKNWKKKKIF